MEARSWFRMLQPPAGAQLTALLDFAAARRAHYPTFLFVLREAAPGQSGESAAFASHASPPPPQHPSKRAARHQFETIDKRDSGEASDSDDLALRGNASNSDQESDLLELPELTDLLDSLEPHLVTQATTDRWPGSGPRESRARVLFYRLDHQSALALAKVHSLASFVPPLPEDLSILASDKTPWLVTQSREQRFLLHLTHEEARAIGKGLPWLRLEPEANGPDLGIES